VEDSESRRAIKGSDGDRKSLLGESRRGVGEEEIPAALVSLSAGRSKWESL
jgi:hypothetical protein